MAKKLYVQEAGLAALAKKFREASGLRKAAAARELGVDRSNVQLAEEHPQQSMTKMRIRMIEKYSKCRVTGPFYLVEQK